VSCPFRRSPADREPENRLAPRPHLAGGTGGEAARSPPIEWRRHPAALGALREPAYSPIRRPNHGGVADADTCMAVPVVRFARRRSLRAPRRVAAQRSAPAGDDALAVGPVATSFSSSTDVWNAPASARLFDTNGDGVVNRQDDPSWSDLRQLRPHRYRSGSALRAIGTTPSACTRESCAFSTAAPAPSSIRSTRLPDSSASPASRSRSAMCCATGRRRSSR